MSVFEQATFNLTWGGSVERIGAARVDESFFTTLQSAPEIGRAIGADDNQPGHDRVAVISHSLWHSMFADSTDILERSLLLEGVRYRIVGVMPPAFEYPSNSDLPYGNAGESDTHLDSACAHLQTESGARTGKRCGDRSLAPWGLDESGAVGDEHNHGPPGQAS